MLIENNFPAKMKALRESRKMSQAALAEKAGTRQATIADLEAGKQKPSWETACALADALGVPVGKLR